MTHQPTHRPSSRPTINIVPPIPKITALVIRASSSNASVSVAFTATKSFPGTVYCLFTSSGNASVPTSVNMVRSTGVAVTYASLKDSPVTVTATGLRAMKSYMAYCTVMLSTGVGISYSDMIKGKKAFTTGCCKQVTFTSAPTTVFGDITNYATGSSSSYVFQYTLGDAPSIGSVTVIPIVTPITGSTEPVVVSPSSLSFQNTSNTAQLKGQFFLSANDSTTGLFQVSLKITGTKSLEFGSNNRVVRTVQLISGKAPLPAPSLVSALFGDSGSYILIIFSRDTDFAGITANTWPCSTLFLFVGASDVSCVWINKHTVRGNFLKLSGSANSLLSPGGKLSLWAPSVTVPGIRAACQAGTTCSLNAIMGSTSVVVQDAVNPIVPTVVLSLPTNLGACSPMKVDLSMSTGNGGRPWQSVEWNVVATVGDPSPVLDALYNYFDPIAKQAVIPAAAFSPAIYFITTTLTNFLNSTATQAASIAVSTDPNLPVVTILGPSVQVIKALASLKLAGSAKLSACAVPSTLKYTWTVVDSATPNVVLTSLVSTSLDASKYVLPGYSLTYGETYTVTLLVQVYSSTNTLLSLGSGTTSVFIGPGNINALIRGGSTRNVAVDKSFSLDASISTDDNYPPVRTSNRLSYSWTCTDTSTLSACTFSSPTFTTATNSTLTVPANVMTVKGVYTIAVIVTSTDGRTGTASVVTTGAAPGAPTVTAGNKVVKFNTDATLAVLGYITSSVPINASWTGFFAGTTPMSLKGAVTPLQKVFSASQVMNTGSFPVSFPGGFFTPGRIYTFRLTAWTTGDSTVRAHADVTVTANSPPVGTFRSFVDLLFIPYRPSQHNLVHCPHNTVLYTALTTQHCRQPSQHNPHNTALYTALTTQPCRQPSQHNPHNTTL